MTPLREIDALSGVTLQVTPSVVTRVEPSQYVSVAWYRALTPVGRVSWLYPRLS